MMPGAEGHGEALEDTGHTDGQPAAETLPGTHTDGLRHPAAEWAEEIIPEST